MVNTVVTKDLDCTASPDAVITGTVGGGTAPYTYSVSHNGGTFGASVAIAGTTFTYTTPNDGNYVFEITDSRGCTIQSSVTTINAIVPVTASNSTIDPTCNGDTNGSITLTGTTGAAPFTYSIDGGSTFVSTNVFGGLSAGSYNYVVMDSKGCDVSGTVNLTDPAPINASFVRNPIQCNSNVPGSIDITIDSGGVAPFTYAIFDNTFTQIGTDVTIASISHTFNGLSFGDYYITIVDANGCDFISNALRIETPPNVNVTGNATTGTCATGATVDLQVISGVAPFTYAIFGQPATAFGPTVSTTHTFTNLNHGTTYFFEVIDAGGCTSVVEVTTPTLSAININSLTTNNINCNGDTSGVVNFTVSDYDASVTSVDYRVLDELTNTPIVPAQNGTLTGLTGSPASGSISGLPAGNYTLFVREANGTLCTSSSTFRITQPIQPLFSTIVDNTNATCNTDAQITLTTTGGTGPYQYAIGAVGFIPTPADFGNSNVLYLDYTIRTNWDIVIRDANGCEVRLNETISLDPEPIISASVNNQCTVTEGNFENRCYFNNTGYCTL